MNLRWAEDQDYLFELWSDDDKALALHYGAIQRPSAVFPQRITKILDANGDLILEYVSDVGPGTHPQKVLEDCRLLFGP